MLLYNLVIGSGTKSYCWFMKNQYYKPVVCSGQKNNNNKKHKTVYFTDL